MGIKLGTLVAILPVAFSVAIILASSAAAATTQQYNPQGAIESLQVNIPSLHYVKVTFAAGANVSVVSVSGGVYDLTVSSADQANTVQFEPMNSSLYHLVMASVSSGPNFAQVSVEGSPHDTLLANFSSYGDIALNLSVNSTGTPQTTTPVAPADSGPAPRFFTPVGIEVLGALAAATGVYLLVLGVRYRPEFSLAGLALLSVGGMAVLGILLALEMIAVYLAGFVAVSVAWKVRARRRG